MTGRRLLAALSALAIVAGTLTELGAAILLP